GRIETILNWARVRGYREGDNPARWKGHLDHLLPAKGKVRRVQHHAAMSYADLPGFMNALREQDSVAARAFEFLVLTAARTGEVIGACWKEIDLKNRLWTVPAERMKAEKAHRVPLCPRAIAILETIKSERVAGDAFVFPGSRPQKPQSNMVFLMLLRRMNLGHLTATRWPHLSTRDTPRIDRTFCHFLKSRLCPLRSCTIPARGRWAHHQKGPKMIDFNDK